MEKKDGGRPSIAKMRIVSNVYLGRIKQASGNVDGGLI